MENNTVITVQLGGRMWELKCGHKVLQMFCATTKVRMSQLTMALDRYDLLTEMLFCMIWLKDSNVTRAQLDDWLEEADFVDVVDKVTDAIIAAFPKQEGGEEGDDEARPQTAAGTGMKA